MKTLVVISDTHGSKSGVESILPIVKENDYVVHLGDGASEFGVLVDANPKGCYFCTGNCDAWGNLPEEGVLELEDVKIFYCHGHRYGVKSCLDRLANRARALGCKIALYGHTHNARVDEVNGVTLVCPGALRAPKDRGGSYAYVVVAGEKVTATIVGENVW